MGADYKLGVKPPQLQTDIYMNQANPGSGTLYDVLNAVNVEIHSIAITCDWTVQPTPLQLWIILDGMTHRYDQANPVSGTYYLPVTLTTLPPAGPHLMRAVGAVYTDMSPNFPIGKGFKQVIIQAEVTGGTVQWLRCRVKYSIYF